jgi:ABC-type sugar transport system substrate-binding protein
MKLAWKALATGTSMFAALAITLGATAVATAQTKKTLVFVVNGASDFWKIAEAGVKKAQGELPKYTLQFRYPEQAAAAVQQRVMEDLVAAGAAGIMVSAVDPKNQTADSTRSQRSRCCSPPTPTRRSPSAWPTSARPTSTSASRPAS